MTTTEPKGLRQLCREASDAKTEAVRSQQRLYAVGLREREAARLVDCLWNVLSISESENDAVHGPIRYESGWWLYDAPTVTIDGLTFDLWHEDNNRVVLRATWVCDECHAQDRAVVRNRASLGAALQMHIHTGQEAHS